ncbi:hypothetical protein T459_04013 [Capsicum annuum]|uniref:Ethylene-responsive transcription factor ERF026-like n=1 Tax=Capsicum annuum TaxID=4072 RepID=A0A2G3APH0_CAPAN|nr:hypothetical protein T459_04013 [Capsicum annuum]
MAAAAYDVAVLALKEAMAYRGDDDRLLVSSSGGTTCNEGGSVEFPSSSENYAMQMGSTQMVRDEEEYVDEEALFDFPSLIVNMAEAMMLSPPRINTFPSEDYSSGEFDGESLWSY